jgi:uncharacterized YigZ family protein
MEKDEFLTLEKPAQGTYKEKGSRFLGFAFPVESEDQVKTRLERIKNQYHDARHHCYAYRLGADHQTFRMNDDGEPSSTAGRPIYGQIQSYQLTNVLVVVVRYFGGTLLGTSGLIRAYKQAAGEALKQAKIIKKTVKSLYQLEFDYALMGEVMRLLHETGIQPYEREFKRTCKFRIGIRKSQESKVSQRFNRIKGLELERIDGD